MADSSSAAYDLKLTVTETIDVGLDLASNKEHQHKITSPAASGTLTSSTTVPVTKTFSDTFTLSSGSSTLDLTALVRDNLPNVDMTGLKVQLFKVACPSTNTAAVVVADGSSNGYEVYGDANGQVTVHQGGQDLRFVPDKLDDVAAADKTIDFTSADTDATVSVIICAG